MVKARYVDDTFTILDRDRVDSFLQHLNSQQPTIRFTMKTENDNKIAFLDASVSREPDGSLTTSVYRKPTYTDRYLAYDSHHPQSVKRGIVKGLRSSRHQRSRHQEVDSPPANSPPRSLIHMDGGSFFVYRMQMKHIVEPLIVSHCILVQYCLLSFVSIILRHLCPVHQVRAGTADPGGGGGGGGWALSFLL